MSLKCLLWWWFVIASIMKCFLKFKWFYLIDKFSTYSTKNYRNLSRKVGWAQENQGLRMPKPYTDLYPLRSKFPAVQENYLHSKFPVCPGFHAARSSLTTRIFYGVPQIKVPLHIRLLPLSWFLLFPTAWKYHPSHIVIAFLNLMILLSQICPYC